MKVFEADLIEFGNSFDMSKEADRERLSGLLHNSDEAGDALQNSFKNFINEGIAPIYSIRDKKNPLYGFDNQFIEIKNNLVHFNGRYELHSEILGYDASFSHANYSLIPSAVLVDNANKEGLTAHLLLLNGDENTWPPLHPAVNFNEDGDFSSHPTISFNCLARLVLGNKFHEKKAAKHIADVAKMVGQGKVGLVDYVRDSTENLTAKEWKQVEKCLKSRKSTKTITTPKLPERLGYTLMNYHSKKSASWHRAASVVMKYENTYMLMGQDEGSYFGVVLPKKCKTVAEAFEMLIPKEVKGKAYKRQGEWFAVQVPASEVPEMVDCVLQFDTHYNDGEVFLPLEDVNSNHHRIASADGRVSRDGRVYVKGNNLNYCGLDHDQHATLYFEKNKWYTFYKNTAVRSVSVGGVD